MRRLLAISLAALLCIAAACGGDDGGDDTSTTSTTKADTPVQAQLRTRLLVASDLPTGWTKDTAHLSDVDAEAAAPKCLQHPNDHEAVEVSAQFLQTSGFPALREELRTYPDGDAAEEQAAQVDRASKCGRFDLDSGGETVKGEVTRVASAPTFGESSATFDVLLRASGPGDDLHLVVTYLRTGDRVVTLQYAQSGDVDQDAVNTIAAAAAAKL
jgi:hypothetical protein